MLHQNWSTDRQTKHQRQAQAHLTLRDNTGPEFLPHQIPPDGNWDTWMIRGGRGAGKTFTGAHYVLDHLRKFGSQARVGVGAPTIGDARDVCAEGKSGIMTLAGSEFNYNRSLMEGWHRNGGYIKFLGSEKPDRWNGPEWSLVWADELSLWREKSYHEMLLGLRLDPAELILTLTPRPRKFLKEIVADESTVVTTATTRDNPHLSKHAIDRLYRKYGGTRLGRQQLDGEFIDEIEGALWSSSWIYDNRVDEAPRIARSVVAIDPAGTATSTSNRTGIAVASIGVDGDYYLRHCTGYKLSPLGWADMAIEFYLQYDADWIIAERNNGGDMVESTIKQAAGKRDIDVRVKTIHASKGKTVRAEPVALLHEQGRIHHVGQFHELEENMFAFPLEHEYDDEIDAMVYSMIELMNTRGPTKYVGPSSTTSSSGWNI